MSFLKASQQKLWTNPNEVPLGEPFIYYIAVNDGLGNEYRYVGKARNEARLHEYRRNMEKIHAGKRRGENQRYRAVHLALYRALQNGWAIDFYPLEPCASSELNQAERKLKSAYDCNLNGAQTWPIEARDQTEVANLV